MKMIKTQISKRIIAYEIVGFLFVVMILWIDELFDLPHRLLGAPATPVNFIESAFETILISILAVLILILIHTLLKRIIAGTITVCSFCKKIRIDDRWVPIDIYIRDNSEAEFSHGVCSQCSTEHYGNLSG
jgi:hypothetical protein